jgi:hypothetical protein
MPYTIEWVFPSANPITISPARVLTYLETFTPFPAADPMGLDGILTVEGHEWHRAGDGVG